MRSSLSLPIVVAHEGLGSLNIYDRRVAYFDDDAVRLGELLAGQCAVVGLFWSASNDVAGLALALQSRATIEQAKGVIMAATGVEAEAAFEVLRQQSQQENRKLREIAEEIVARQRRPAV